MDTFNTIMATLGQFEVNAMNNGIINIGLTKSTSNTKYLLLRKLTQRRESYQYLMQNCSESCSVEIVPAVSMSHLEM